MSALDSHTKKKIDWGVENDLWADPKSNVDYAPALRVSGLMFRAGYLLKSHQSFLSDNIRPKFEKSVITAFRSSVVSCVFSKSLFSFKSSHILSSTCAAIHASRRSFATVKKEPIPRRRKRAER